MQYFKDTYGGEKGHCYDCGETWWKVKPTSHRTRKIKLHKTDTRLTTETLQRSREFLTEVFDSDAKVFGLRADTGVGKSHAVIQHVYKGIQVLLNLPHKNLMHEMSDRFNTAEIPAFAYRGILSNPTGTFPHDSPCIQPYIYDAYAQKGGNPRDAICSRCPQRDKCEEAGHWHDIRQLKKHQVSLFTFPQLFTNPIFRGWIQTNIGTLEKDDLMLHDDTEITELFNCINITREYLEELTHRHPNTKTAEVVNNILASLHKETRYEDIKHIINAINRTERDFIIKRLSHIAIQNGYDTAGRPTHEFVTLDDAVRTGHLKADTQTDINALPKLSKPDWTLLHQLELFFDCYPYTENAPIHYHDGVLSFAMPPLLPKTKARIGFIGATLKEEHLKRAFPEPYYPNVMYFDATSTAWHPDARMYQLATNKNPRSTVLTDGKLNATGQGYWETMIDIVSRIAGRHAVISYQSVLKEKQADIEKHDLITAHFGGLTGLDALFKDIDYLHILFSPERPPEALEWNSKIIYGADDKILSFDRDEEGGGKINACNPFMIPAQKPS